MLLEVLSIGYASSGAAIGPIVAVQDKSVVFQCTTESPCAVHAATHGSQATERSPLPVLWRGFEGLCSRWRAVRVGLDAAVRAGDVSLRLLLQVACYAAAEGGWLGLPSKCAVKVLVPLPPHVPALLPPSATLSSRLASSAEAVAALREALAVSALHERELSHLEALLDGQCSPPPEEVAAAARRLLALACIPVPVMVRAVAVSVACLPEAAAARFREAGWPQVRGPGGDACVAAIAHVGMYKKAAPIHSLFYAFPSGITTMQSPPDEGMGVPARGLPGRRAPRRRPPPPVASLIFCRNVVAQLVRLLAFLAEDSAASQPSAKMVHRDVKLPNVLLDGRGVVHLCDFGSAFCAAATAGRIDGERGSAFILEPTTIPISAPETAAHPRFETTSNTAFDAAAAAELWSLGAFLYELVFARRVDHAAHLTRQGGGNRERPCDVSSAPVWWQDDALYELAAAPSSTGGAGLDAGSQLRAAFFAGPHFEGCGRQCSHAFTPLLSAEARPGGSGPPAQAVSGLDVELAEVAALIRCCLRRCPRDRVAAVRRAVVAAHSEPLSSVWSAVRGHPFFAAHATHTWSPDAAIFDQITSQSDLPTSAAGFGEDEERAAIEEWATAIRAAVADPTCNDDIEDEIHMQTLGM